MPIASYPTSVYANLPSNAGVIPTIQVAAPMTNKFFWAIKPGGTLNQILVKNSGTDYDTSWSDNPASANGENLGAGVDLYVPDVPGNIPIRTLNEGDNISFTVEVDGSLTIDATSSGGGSVLEGAFF